MTNEISIRHKETNQVLFSGLRADLQGADLQGADLRGADLREAVLQRANLQRAVLWGADLQRADLQRADLRGANLRGADLREAVLQGADLREAVLWRANLQRADLRGAVYDVPLTRPPITITGFSFSVVVTDRHVQIGCQRHTIEKWAEFDSAAIRRMGGLDHQDEWADNRDWLLALARAHQKQCEQGAKE